MLEVAILLMTYLIEYVFNMITGKNKSKLLAKDISCKFKCKFDGKNVTQINGGIMINGNANVKNVVYLKNILFKICDM